MRIQGKVHHFIGPLLPNLDSTAHSFVQLYVNVPDNELHNRRAYASNQDLDLLLLQMAQEALYTCNPLIQQFNSAVEFVSIKITIQILK